MTLDLGNRVKSKIKMLKPKFNIDIESLIQLPGRVHVYWKDIKGIYQGCNDLAAEKFLLRSRNDVRDKTDFQLPFQEAELYRQEDKAVLQTGQLKKFQSHCTLPSYKIDFLTVKMPLFDEKGKITGVLGISYYQTEIDLNSSDYALPETKFPISAIVSNDLLKQKPRNSIEQLTQRQLDCLRYLVRGMTMKQIANEMSLSPRTIEHYLEAIKRKFNCHSRADIIAKAFEINFDKC